MSPPRTKKAVLISALADRLGYLDKVNLNTIRFGIPAFNGGAHLSDASAISLALNIAARVIKAGDLERYRPAYVPLNANGLPAQPR